MATLLGVHHGRGIISGIISPYLLWGTGLLLVFGTPNCPLTQPYDRPFAYLKTDPDFALDDLPSARPGLSMASASQLLNLSGGSNGSTKNIWILI